MDRYGQESGKGYYWHPPRAMHMLRGEMIVWLYSLILYETVTMIMSDLQAKDVSVLSTGISPISAVKLISLNASYLVIWQIMQTS